MRPEKLTTREGKAAHLRDYLSKLEERFVIAARTKNIGLQTKCLLISTLPHLPYNLEDQSRWAIYFFSTQDQIGIQLGGRERPVAFTVSKVPEENDEISITVKESDGSLHHPSYDRFRDPDKLRKFSEKMRDSDHMYIIELTTGEDTMSYTSGRVIEYFNPGVNIWNLPLENGPILFPEPPRGRT